MGCVVAGMPRLQQLRPQPSVTYLLEIAFPQIHHQKSAGHVHTIASASKRCPLLQTDLIPVGTNRGLALGLIQQMGAVHCL
jgi:hypothetical protein